MLKSALVAVVARPRRQRAGDRRRRRPAVHARQHTNATHQAGCTPARTSRSTPCDAAPALTCRPAPISCSPANRLDDAQPLLDQASLRAPRGARCRPACSFNMANARIRGSRQGGRAKATYDKADSLRLACEGRVPRGAAARACELGRQIQSRCRNAPRTRPAAARKARMRTNRARRRPSCGPTCQAFPGGCHENC